MSAKPRGTNGAVPELTKLKLLWRDSLDEAQRDFWRSQFAGTSTQAQLRALLNREHGITLGSDSQLTLFRNWVEEQDARAEEAERQAEDEAQAHRLHPEWSDEQRRLYVINCSLNRAIATGDFAKLGLKAVKAAQAEKQISLDRDKFEHLKAQAAKAEATDKALTNSALTPEQRAQRIREIYGRA